MRNMLVGIAVVGALAGTPARAADMALKAPPPPPPAPVFSWTGCHIGGDIGATWFTDKDNETFTATGAVSPFSPYPANTSTPAGVTIGGYGGCDYQFSSGLLLGAEGDLEWVSIGGGSADYVGTGFPADYYQTRSHFQTSARGRLGYAFNRVLVYATGGAAWANIIEQDVIGATGFVQQSSTTQPGWTVGGGLEYAFLDDLIGRVEYRYSDFGTFSYMPTLAFPAFTENHRITENTVRIGLSYKFYLFPAPVATRY